MLDHNEIIRNVMAAKDSDAASPFDAGVRRHVSGLVAMQAYRPTPTPPYASDDLGSGGAPAAPAVDRPDARSAALAAAKNQGLAEGVAGERKRIAGILNHPSASGREWVAQTLAFKTEMSVEQAGAFLGEVPALSRSSGANAIDTAAIYSARAGRTPLDTTDIYASRAAAPANGSLSPAAAAGSEDDSADVYARRAAQAKGSPVK
jgi:hypothetical protein